MRVCCRPPRPSKWGRRNPSTKECLMIDCQKAQTEHNNGQTICRCVHTKAEQFKQIVSEDICSACPVRIARRVAPQTLVQLRPNIVDEIPMPQHGGQLWLENGQFIEKVGNGETFLLGDWVETRLSSIGITK